MDWSESAADAERASILYFWTVTLRPFRGLANVSGFECSVAGDFSIWHGCLRRDSRR
jgi:hypothetical protein